MIGRVRELFAKIENHVDMLDDLADYVDKAINTVRKHFGY
jgi:hypothetical protein